MSQISLKSISGITSITTPTGADNQFTLHTNNTNEALKLDGAGNLHFHNHLNITGISTASNFKTGTSNLHNTGLNVQDLDVDGHTNLDNVNIAGVTTTTENIRIQGNNKYLTVGASNQIGVVHTGGEAFITNSSGHFTHRSDVHKWENYAGSSEYLRIGSAGQIGAAGANYGTSGQVLTSGGASGAVSWSTITGTTINNNADNRVITGSGTANTLNGESSVIIDSSGNLIIDAAGVGNASTYARNLFISGSSNNGITIHTTDTSGSNRKCCIFFGTGTSVADMADGMLFYDNAGQYFHMSTAGGGTGVTQSSMRLSSDGTVRFDSTPTTTNSISLLLKSHKARAVDDNNGILFRDSADHSQAAIYVQKKSTSNGTSDLVFATSNGQVVTTLQGIPERLRIDSSGRIGSQHNLSGVADYNRLMLHNPNSGSCWMQLTSTATGSTPNTDGLSIGLNTSNIAHFWLRENAEMHFATNNSLRWRITSSGDIYPQGNYKIGLNSNTAFRMDEVNSSKFVHRYGNSGSATNNQQEAIWYGGGITTMHDNSTLSTSNYTWGLTGSRGYALIRVRNNSGQAIYAESGSISSGSDYRMKENIVEITNGIETVKKLKPSIFNIRKSFNPNDDGKKHHGFIAHEVQEAIPDIGNIVSGTKDAMEEVFYGVDEDDVIPEGKKAGDSTGTFTNQPDYQGIDYGHMTPVLAAAIKELITKVETLEAEVASLKSS